MSPLYHQQSLEYVNRKLREISNIDHGQGFEGKSIEHANDKSRLNCDVEPSAGFGPATITLPR